MRSAVDVVRFPFRRHCDQEPMIDIIARNGYIAHRRRINTNTMGLRPSRCNLWFTNNRQDRAGDTKTTCLPRHGRRRAGSIRHKATHGRQKLRPRDQDNPHLTLKSSAATACQPTRQMNDVMEKPLSLTMRAQKPRPRALRPAPAPSQKIRASHPAYEPATSAAPRTPIRRKQTETHRTPSSRRPERVSGLIRVEDVVRNALLFSFPCHI